MPTIPVLFDVVLTPGSIQQQQYETDVIKGLLREYLPSAIGFEVVGTMSTSQGGDSRTFIRIAARFPYSITTDTVTKIAQNAANLAFTATEILKGYKLGLVFS